MTQREAKAASLRAGTAVEASRGADPAQGLRLFSPDDSSALEYLCSHLGAEERKELLVLARRQGLLYAHQLPHQNGKTAQSPSRWQKILAEIIAGGLDEQSSSESPAPLIDTNLDPAQRAAVHKALATHDVCLIVGLPGTGKSRVVKEIILQAAHRGERILFLAPQAAPADRLLETFADTDAVYSLRLRGTAETVPPQASRFLFAERQRALREETLASAIQARNSAEERCRTNQQLKQCWPELHAIIASASGLDRSLRELECALANVETAVEQAAMTGATNTEAPFVVGVLKHRTEQQAALKELDVEQEAVRAAIAQYQGELAGLRGQIASCQSTVAARASGQWWTWKWWQALLAASVAGQLAEVQSQVIAAEAKLAEAEQRGSELSERRTKLEQQYHAHLAQMQQEEIARRRGELQERIQQHNNDRAALQRQWQQLVSRIQPDQCQPATMTAAAVDTAHAAWQQQLARDEQSCQFATQWAGFLQDTLNNVSEKLLGMCNLVAGTHPGLVQDRQALEGIQHRPFDLLIIEEAHQLTEEEFLRAAGHARRCVLVGEPAWQYEPQLPRPARAGPSREAPRLLQTLWERLHRGPQDWPFAWVANDRNLRCRFREVPPAHRRFIECEEVADFPEVELHILTCPSSDPVLAEVVFPLTMSIAQAKQYIFQELQELPVQANAGQSLWVEDIESVSLLLSDRRGADETIIELEPGIREVVQHLPQGRNEVCWITQRLEFDRHAGWTRERAENWTARYLPAADSSRAALLQVPYRMAAPLAEFVSETIFPGGYFLATHLRPANGPTNSTTPAQSVFFVPVPALRKGEATIDLPKGGAGLELDLTSARSTDRLPPDLRTNLPTRGFVNYPEARSVVRKLEELHRQLSAASSAPTSIAVVALFAGQVELIRGLINRSEILKQNPIPIEVGMPTDFTHREFPIVFLSLTRSHSHRAVTYADDFSHLTLAMTRARTQLYLFGDAGTLLHRSRANDGNGRAEQQAISVLVQYLQGHGKHSQAFQLCSE